MRQPRPMYHIWRAMMRRCYDPADKSYKNYGARGIRVCRRWHKFVNFVADIGQRPSTAHSIERIDNDGGYNPKNFKWATSIEQNRNRRSNRWFELDGRRMLMVDWTREYGISKDALSFRLARGLTFREALTAPLRGSRHLRRS